MHSRRIHSHPRRGQRLSACTGLALAALVGCGMPAQTGPFGLGGKADTTFSSCQQTEAVKLANTAEGVVLQQLIRQGVMLVHPTPEGGATPEHDALVTRLTQQVLIAVSPRGFTTADELGGAIKTAADDDAFIAEAVVARIVATSLPACPDDLVDGKYIDSEAVLGDPAGSWERKNSELESALTMLGVDGKRLHAALSKLQSDEPRNTGEPRTLFSELRDYKQLAGMTYGAGADEMPWGRSYQRMRERFPYLGLTVESVRYQLDAEDRRRELDLVTHFFIDAYYDTIDYQLLRNNMLLRARQRWNSEGLHRLLIAVKFDSRLVDGIKRAEKVDTRAGGNVELAKALFDETMGGRVTWESGVSKPVVPVQDLYEKLKAVAPDTLQDIGAKQGVLQISPKIFMRSVRSRYHFDLASVRDLQAVHDYGRKRIELVIAWADKALAAGTLDPNDQATVAALKAQAEGLLDGSLVKAAAQRRVDAEIGNGATVTDEAAQFFLSGNYSEQVADRQQLRVHEIVAEETHRLFEAFGDAVDDADRFLDGSAGLDALEDYVEPYVAFKKSQDSGMLAKTVVLPFYKRYRALLESCPAGEPLETCPAVVAEVEEFNIYGEQQKAAGDEAFEDFAQIDAATFVTLGPVIAHEVLGLTERVVTTAGLVTKALWFDQAREYYVPESRRPWGNFYIDTIDFTEFFTPATWNAMSETERDPKAVASADKVLHATLVNEVQIELGQEEEYLKRVNELQALIDGGSATDEDRQNFDGASFIYRRFVDTMIELAQLKGDHLRKEIADGSDIRRSELTWDAAKYSKGQLGLRYMTGQSRLSK